MHCHISQLHDWHEAGPSCHVTGCLTLNSCCVEAGVIGFRAWQTQTRAPSLVTDSASWSAGCPSPLACRAPVWPPTPPAHPPSSPHTWLPRCLLIPKHPDLCDLVCVPGVYMPRSKPCADPDCLAGRLQGLRSFEAKAAIAGGVNAMLAAQTTARICLLQVLTYPDHQARAFRMGWLLQQRQSG